MYCYDISAALLIVFCFVLPEADGNRPFRSAPLGHEPQEGLLQKGEGEAEPHGPRPAA